MSLALADAHIHLADLLARDPDFPARLSRIADTGISGDSRAKLAASARRASRWTCCAASHDEAEWRRTEALRPSLPPFVSSFGIHPQWAVWDHADFLANLAAQGRLAAIGEAGFDFFGDRPERVREPANERAQTAVFEYQLELAERLGIPLLLHLRKAMDLAFAYAPRLKRLPAAVFHSFPGSAQDAESLLARGVSAYFSFGAGVINGNKRAAAACAAVPESSLLAETDAPWQPPRGAEFCRAEDLAGIVEGMALLRGRSRDEIAELTAANFARAYALAPPP
jgi:TatD DNase family protein